MGKLRPERERDLLKAAQRPLTIEELEPEPADSRPQLPGRPRCLQLGEPVTFTPPCSSSWYQHILSSAGGLQASD